MIGTIGYVFICTTAILVYVVYNLMRKVESLEDAINASNTEHFNIRSNIKSVIENMREIDTKGGFESDDEVGSVFDGLKNIIGTMENKDG